MEHLGNLKHLMNLVLNEIFHSIQGEGPNTGHPSIFVRLGGCNLRCTWCDTKYTWDPKVADNFNSTVEDVVKEIRKYPCKHLVITGGEPMLQQDKVKMLLQELKGYTAEIETNGSIRCRINSLIEQINCSPKLSNSGNRPYALKILPTNRKVIYKFVVQKRSDLDEIKAYAEAHHIPKEKVYLMPEGVTKKAIQEKSEWLVEICKKEGYHFSTRLHVLLYGGKRGV